jgi:hypothetical protein
VLFAEPLHIRMHRAVRKLGGSVRPAGYGAVVANTTKNFEIKPQEDELGPYVCTDLRIANLDLTTARFINIWAGPRKVTYSPVSDIAVGGLSDLGMAFPHPLYISSGSALTIDRLVVAANTVDDSVVIGGFHTEQRVWEILRGRFKEFRSISTGPLGQTVGAVDGPWARPIQQAQPMRATYIFQSARIQTATNALKNIQIDTSVFFRDATGRLPSPMSPLFGSTRIPNFMERDVRELIQAERVGTPTANTEIVDVLGCEL